MTGTEFLGVDIGGVIISRTKGKEDTELSYDSLPGAFEALRQLVGQRFGDKVCIISKAKQSTQDRMLTWLASRNFYEIAGVKPENVNFCRKRNEKADICQKLGVTHFIDDRLEVLGYISAVGVERLYLFQGHRKEIQQNLSILLLVKRVESWEEILAELLGKK